MYIYQVCLLLGFSWQEGNFSSGMNEIDNCLCDPYGIHEATMSVV